MAKPHDNPELDASIERFRARKPTPQDTTCHECGLLVASWQIHNKWHEEFVTDKENDTKILVQIFTAIQALVERRK